MIPARCLTSLNRFQLPSSEATPWLLQPHQGNMSRSWLRDTDSQNGDAFNLVSVFFSEKVICSLINYTKKSLLIILL